jgi:hypothetical protein
LRQSRASRRFSAARRRRLRSDPSNQETAGAVATSVRYRAAQPLHRPPFGPFPDTPQSLGYRSSFRMTFRFRATQPFLETRSLNLGSPNLEWAGTVLCSIPNPPRSGGTTCYRLKKLGANGEHLTRTTTHLASATSEISNNQYVLHDRNSKFCAFVEQF